MRQRLLTLCMIAGCAVLVVAAAILTAAQDKTAPVIKIEDKKKDITYKDGDDYDQLLADVTAEDNRDGDITDKIFVDSITPVSNGKKAIVRYAVIDKSNNVGVKTRVINYKGSGQAEQDVIASETEEIIQKDAEKKENTKKETETTEEKQTATEQKTATEQTKTESTENQEELKPNGTSPAIRLKQSSQTIQRGGTFDVLSVVDQVVDDQDDASVLSRRIHADGEYNTSVAGTYTIRYYVMDTNNNTSNIEEFTLKVQ